jgi:DNA primase
VSDERDEIRSRVDIVDLVSRRVALKRSGKSYTGLCPFHEDKNPSFSVDSRTGRYRCWSCGESGDIFTWVMKTEHVDFVTALKELADMAGVKLEKSRSGTPATSRESFKKAMAEALAFFSEQLSKSQAAAEYCRRRSLDDETLRIWEVGYAPDSGDSMAVRLKRAGVALADGKSLFLVDEDASGGFYDRFRGRLMFPIRDERGELVAFGGRLLGDGTPKYINSSDTPLYRKGHVLYGMHKARDAMAKAKRAVLVEGYLDVIACHRSGVDIAVASLGTALSEDHAKLLKRWVHDVVILYDSDEAGEKAADRAINILEAEGLRVRVALMPKGEDPDTLLRTAGPEAVRGAVTGGVSTTAFRMSQLEKRLTPDQDEFWVEAVSLLKAARQDMEVEKQITRLATMYPGLRDTSAATVRLRQMVGPSKEVRPRVGGQRRPVASPEYKSLKESLSAAEVTVFGALHESEFRRAVWMIMVHLREVFATNTAAEIARAVAEAFPNGPPEGPALQWIHLIEPEVTRQMVGDLLFDIRVANLTETVVADSIRLLKVDAERRELRRLRSGDLTPDQKREAFQRLKKLKPDPRNDPVNNDGDPFS